MPSICVDLDTQSGSICNITQTCTVLCIDMRYTACIVNIHHLEVVHCAHSLHIQPQNTFRACREHKFHTDFKGFLNCCTQLTCIQIASCSELRSIGPNISSAIRFGHYKVSVCSTNFICIEIHREGIFYCCNIIQRQQRNHQDQTKNKAAQCFYDSIVF